jgi:hypothetical protein
MRLTDGKCGDGVSILGPGCGPRGIRVPRCGLPAAGVMMAWMRRKQVLVAMVNPTPWRGGREHVAPSETGGRSSRACVLHSSFCKDFDMKLSISFISR